MKFWIDKISGVALDLKTGVPCYQVEDEEGRIHLLVHLPIEEENEERCCLRLPDQAALDSRSIFYCPVLEEIDVGRFVGTRDSKQVIQEIRWHSKNNAEDRSNLSF
jgi:hypothetical protein